MTKIRVTITWEYDAYPEIYDTDVPEEMAAIDKGNWDNVPELCLQLLEENWEIEDITVKVEPVE